MKTILTFIATLTITTIVWSQNVSIAWQKTIGGDNLDQITAFDATADGGFILGGHSNSKISGEKTENNINGSIDVWIVKVDAAGNIIWQNTIGGNLFDGVNSIKQTADGGYIVGAMSDSGISGDKTENSRGTSDYWILKLDAVGNIIWQKTYGGKHVEANTRVVETPDGGYFVTGRSESDVTGDKTIPSKGMVDFWLLKLNSTGGIVWQKGIGGSGNDMFSGSLPTSEGGYLLYGTSFSMISGDKTEVSRGLSDYWIVKIDVDGNILWDKTYGGNLEDDLKHVIQTTDGGYLLGGISRSSISGDKTEPSRINYDYWILKLNSTGSLVWQKTIGGNAADYVSEVKQLQDGTYLVSGHSQSPISGDKTQNTNGDYDIWLVNLSTTGQILKQNSIGGSLWEQETYLHQLQDGNLVLFSNSNSNISGDKTDNSRGSRDFWVFKTSTQILETQKNTFDRAVTVYPNPTSGIFSLDLGRTHSEINVIITNTDGQIISKSTHQNKQTLNLELKASPGVYLITVTTNDTKQTTFKIIKK